jgi:hypothetical protein
MMIKAVRNTLAYFASSSVVKKKKILGLVPVGVFRKRKRLEPEEI